jgi:hypothetical protein
VLLDATMVSNAAKRMIEFAACSGPAPASQRAHRTAPLLVIFSFRATTYLVP